MTLEDLNEEIYKTKCEIAVMQKQISNKIKKLTFLQLEKCKLEDGIRE